MFHLADLAVVSGKGEEHKITSTRDLHLKLGSGSLYEDILVQC